MTRNLKRLLLCFLTCQFLFTGCGNQLNQSQTATVEIQMPSRSQLKAMIQKAQTESVGTLGVSPDELTKFNDLNCFGLMISGPERNFKGNTCQAASGITFIDAGVVSKGVTFQEKITLDVPVGRRIFHVIGFKLDPSKGQSCAQAFERIADPNMPFAFEVGRKEFLIRAGNNQVVVPPLYIVGAIRVSSCQGPLFTDKSQLFQELNDIQWSKVIDVKVPIGGNPSLQSAPPLQPGTGKTLMHTCALDTQGRLYCWGTNDKGQLGVDSANLKMTTFPQRVLPEWTFKKISLGFRVNCGLVASHTPAGTGPVTAENSLVCWGSNEFGILNTSLTQTSSFTPINIDSNATFKDVSLGLDHACAITINGQARCWGRNQFGQLGRAITPATGTGSAPGALTPQMLGDMNYPTSGPNSGALPANYFESIQSGNFFSCGKRSGTLKLECWGYNELGALGSGSVISDKVSPRYLDGPGEVIGQKAVDSYSVGANHACLISSGETYCWGANRYLQLGRAVVGQQNCYLQATVNMSKENEQCFVNPQIVAPPVGQAFTKIFAGLDFTCGIFELNQVPRLSCWGHNASMELGRGKLNSVSFNVEHDPDDGDKDSTANVVEKPRFILGTVGIEKLFVGAGATCQVFPGNLVRCNGSNLEGQLGNGYPVLTSKPLPLSANLKFKMISSAQATTCGISTVDDLYCWGSNYYGILGPGLLFSLSPWKVSNSKWKSVSVSSNNVCGTTLSGQLYCWGLNSNILTSSTEACYGNDKQQCAVIPQLQAGSGATVLPEVSWETVQISEFLRCATTSSKKLFCWGKNFFGALGLGGSVPNDALVTLGPNTQVSVGDSEILGFGVGFRHVCLLAGATAASGPKVYCAGATFVSGQSSEVNTQTEVTGYSGKATALVSGTTHSCILTDLNTNNAFCWGVNSFYSLGNDSTTPSAAPVQLTGSFNKIYAGLHGTCARSTSDNNYYCWGYGKNYMFLDPDSEVLKKPTLRAELNQFEELFLSNQLDSWINCGLRTNKRVQCWGNNKVHIGTPNSGIPLKNIIRPQIGK